MGQILDIERSDFLTFWLNLLKSVLSKSRIWSILFPIWPTVDQNLTTLLWCLLTRDVGFGIQIGPDLPQMGQILGSPSQNVLKLILKSPIFLFHLGPIWSNLDAKFEITAPNAGRLSQPWRVVAWYRLIIAYNVTSLQHANYSIPRDVMGVSCDSQSEERQWPLSQIKMGFMPVTTAEATYLLS